ncbi:histidine phosphatase family protein [Pedobacter sp. MW01-1-1]|uniref:histidine phosphatase family protein n=1 Tax=Pedobacter sp. MW01-1-1 TaxID=3383027 RepID=UPI003FEE2472
MKKFFILLSFLILGTSFSQAQTTEIWIVRHAEKDTSNPQDKNPDLSVEGQIRAHDLAIYLKKVSFDYAFTTDFKRTRQTIDSLIVPKVKVYTDTKALADTIKQNYLGKTIIIAGHSNTILETIEALGADRPLDMLTEDDYDYIFHLTLKNDKAKVKIDHFGRPHHL